MISQLELLRKYINKPINITSAYRTHTYNKKVGGADNSYHTKGQACDIFVDGMSTKELANIMKILKFDGIIEYPNKGFVHGDTRGFEYHAVDNKK